MPSIAVQPERGERLNTTNTPRIQRARDKALFLAAAKVLAQFGADLGGPAYLSISCERVTTWPVHVEHAGAPAGRQLLFGQNMGYAGPGVTVTLSVAAMAPLRRMGTPTV